MRKLAVALLTFAVAVPLTTAAREALPVAAAEDLKVESTSTYTVDAVTGGVRVQVDLAVTNQVPNKTTGNIIRKTYYEGFGFYVTEFAANVSVVSAEGAPLAATLEPSDNEGFAVLDIEFAKNIFYQQTARMTVTYDLVGDEPRGETGVRINPSYSSFEAYGIGDSGLTTVRVVIPDFYETETFGSEVERSLGGGVVTYSATAIENPNEFGIFVSARNDNALESERVTIDGNDYAVNHWPGDDEWSNYVQTQIDDGLPVLEELIGQDWPIDQRFVVRQTNTPYLYGYAGWFSTVSNDIEIGEDLDQETMLHELSHAWFNSELFDERWLSEGFAQTYSNQAIEELDGTPGRPTIPRASDEYGFDLNRWNDLSVGDDTEAEETYGYNTSWYVVDKVTDELGFDTMRDVLAVIATDELPYKGRVSGQRDDTTVYSWQRLLDWSEQLDDESDLQALLVDWVLTSSDAAFLDKRNDARTAYESLEDAGDSWTVPVGIRVAMSGWEFDRIDETVASGLAVLEARNDLRAASKRVGVTIPGTFQEDYEAADNSVDALAAIRTALEDQLDAVEAVEVAIAAAAAPRDFMTRIGLMGTDVTTPLAQARAELSAGNPDAARAAAQEETRLLADAPDVGKGRVMWTVGGVVGAVLLLLVVILLLRRRGRRRRAAVAATAAAAVLAADPADSSEPADPVPAESVSAHKPAAGLWDDTSLGEVPVEDSSSGPV